MDLMTGEGGGDLIVFVMLVNRIDCSSVVAAMNMSNCIRCQNSSSQFNPFTLKC